MQAFIYKKSLQLWTEHVLDEYKGPGRHLNHSSQLTQPLFDGTICTHYFNFQESKGSNSEKLRLFFLESLH